MKRQYLMAATAVAALALVLSACTGGDGNRSSTASSDNASAGFGGTIRVAGIPATIDPMSTSQRAAGRVAAQACEGLFASTADLGVADGLVDTWTYDEATLTYHFALRHGVPFQDGTMLKAADVVASLDRYAASAPGATFGGLVKTIEAKGDFDVDLVLKTPSGAIPALLATPDTAAYIMPASLVEGRDPTDALQKLVCTGPYKLDSYVPDESVVLTRFDKYAARTEPSDGAAGAKVAYADEIDFVPSSDANVANLIISGEADVAPDFALDQVPTVESEPGVTVNAIPSGAFPLMEFNTKTGVMANQTLRQAVQAALDDTSIMAAVAPNKKYVTLDSSLMPKGSPWYSQAGADSYNMHNVELSRQLQKKAGYAGEQIVLIYRASDTYTPVVVQQLQDAGFNVKAVLLDTAAFVATRKDDAKWNLFMSGGTSYGDPLTVVFLSPSFPGWWDTPQQQQLLAKFKEGADQKTRQAVWTELQGLIYEQVPFVRFGGRSQIDLTSSNIGNYPLVRGTARGFYNVTVKK
ncbi:ABC transporter substrate-binding protein [Cellulomonas sp. P24]|uniref:ABC transporter substrate-binding protein n=1 Tax=Cellulomonas sp. P24 TaxID=2885206 RepID=UPI00216AF711|nr:ABC transporter substrate-binding protein [Cellulomonas sp. P24]MCR6492216.1 ABC transporter substrate-binding protein [Cellulomonas sp. P24]